MAVNSITNANIKRPVPGVAGTASADVITVQGIASMTPLMVDLAGTTPSRAYRSVVSITRPSNTTAYAAGDVIGIADAGTPANAGSAIHTLSSIGPSAGFVTIQSVELFIGNTSVPSGMSSFRLHLYTASPTAILDNAAFDLVSGDVSGYVGYIDLPTPQDFGSTLYSQADYSGRLIKLATASTTLYAQLETKGAYTPASGTLYTLRVKTLEAAL